MICGPKNSGKSTFMRILTNKILTDTRLEELNDEETTEEGVILLDLDPGQPEFVPPGQLSLVHLRQPTFGPPFSHPSISERSGNRLVRAHSVAATTPKDDPRTLSRMYG